MEKVILFDTSLGSPNKGDEIIMQSCERGLKPILDNKFVFRIATHTPMSHWYQNFRWFNVCHYYRDVNYKFVCGTNLLNANMLLPTPLWNINIFNGKIAKGAILVGVGLGSKKNKPNLYTRFFYKKVLSKDYVHSTRDERSAAFLRSMGFKAINTGCVTTWGLTNEFCADIDGKKSESVIFTLTDYNKDKKRDIELIEILLKNYKQVFFWLQGTGDYDYIKELGYLEQVELVNPSVSAYEEILNQHVDYIGTRLHAGIKALQHKRRALILSVDNRADDMKQNLNLPIISRENVTDINQKIYEDWKICPNIHSDNIKIWLDQF